MIYFFCMINSPSANGLSENSTLESLNNFLFSALKIIEDKNKM